MSTPDEALAECQTQMKAQAQQLTFNDSDLSTFVGKFRGDFETVMSTNTKAWTRDSAKVTTLARSIASFAEFLALNDVAMPTEIHYSHLKQAYQVLAPFCKADGVSTKKQYCTNATP